MHAHPTTNLPRTSGSSAELTQYRQSPHDSSIGGSPVSNIPAYAAIRSVTGRTALLDKCEVFMDLQCTKPPNCGTTGMPMRSALSVPILCRTRGTSPPDGVPYRPCSSTRTRRNTPHPGQGVASRRLRTSCGRKAPRTLSCNLLSFYCEYSTKQLLKLTHGLLSSVAKTGTPPIGDPPSTVNL